MKTELSVWFRANRFLKVTLLQSKEKVAIKVVDASKFTSITEIECVQEEIRILQTIKHENIINLIEVLFIHNKFYFVMEFAEGGPLTSALKNGPVPVRIM